MLGQELDQGQRGVRFDGVADGVGDLGKGFLEERETAEDVLLRVDIEGSAVGGGKVGERNGVSVQGSAGVGEGAWVGVANGLGPGPDVVS